MSQIIMIESFSSISNKYTALHHKAYFRINKSTHYEADNNGEHVPQSKKKNAAKYAISPSLYNTLRTVRIKGVSRSVANYRCKST